MTFARITISLTAPIFFGGAVAAQGEEVLLPGLLDLPVLEIVDPLPSCDFWFQQELRVDDLLDEICLRVDRGKEDAALFTYWHMLGARGWEDLNGGGPSVWASNKQRCIFATFTIYPDQTPDTSDWTKYDLVLRMSVTPLEGCSREV